MVKAKAVREPRTASVSTESHTAKKPAEKKVDADASAGPKSQRMTQVVDLSSGVLSTPKTPAPAVPFQSIAMGDHPPADEASNNEAAPKIGDGSVDNALSAVSGIAIANSPPPVFNGPAKSQGSPPILTTSDVQSTISDGSLMGAPTNATTAVREDTSLNRLASKLDGVTSEQENTPIVRTPAVQGVDTQVPSAAQNETSQSSISTLAGNVSRGYTVRTGQTPAQQQGTTKVTGTSARNEGKGLASAPTPHAAASDGKAEAPTVDADVAASSSVARPSSDSSLAPDANGQAPAPQGATGTDANSLAQLASVLPASPNAVAAIIALDTALPTSDPGEVLSLSSEGSSAVTNAVSKSSVPGAGSSVTKPKSGTADALSPASPAATTQKVAEIVPPAVIPNATSLAAQTTAHNEAAPPGLAKTNSTSTQHGSSQASNESAPPTSTTAAPQSWDASATQVVHRAQLIQAMHQSEMRMGMNSAEFGNISISAAVSHQTLTAQISLDHPELSRALTAQLPMIEKELGNAYGLPSRVEVRDSSSSSQQGSSHDEDRSQPSTNRVSGVSQTSLGSAGVVGEAASNRTYYPAAGMRLDILI